MEKNEIIVPKLNNETIESMIYIVRGQKVMLDFELAKIYGYETKAFNQQVNRNIEKFPMDFMFKVNKDELNSILMSQNVTSSWGGNRKLPYSFTEQGMLDFEPAKIYGYSTKAFNQQVKNNINKFPERYRFRLTKDELDKLSRSQNVTAQIWATNKGGRTSLPYAFTEQGIYMLMTVLKGELATKQSLTLVRAFKQMKDYIVENKDILSTNETIKLTNLVYEHFNKNAVIENKLEIVI